jgi:CheY-like chemotaxis protein
MRPVNIQDTLSVFAEMLPRVLSENIQVKIHAASSGQLINADTGMVEQMLMNLAVNARDAMPEGGSLTISAEVVELTPALARLNQEARPGQFMRVSVTDTGCGIPAAFLPRIFEPFFTTKPVGKGTGLGLAAVYGIAKQHGGWVEAQSQPGQGSTFQIFLPTCASQPESPPAQSKPQPLKGGNETILVAEDEDTVREFIVRLLESYGYKVLSARSGKEAIARWGGENQRIDLLLTDMVMPGGISGHQLAEELSAKNPALRVIYTSGYSPGTAGKDHTWLQGGDFLAKPYAPATLVQRVRSCLDR